MPTLKNALETIKYKIAKYGENEHCSRIIVAEEARREAIENKPSEDGHRRTRISMETYSAEAYSSWNSTLEYLIERCAYNPILLVDVLLLLVQEARQRTESDGVDGLDIAKGMLFKLGNYDEKLQKAKEEWRARRKRK